MPLHRTMSRRIRWIALGITALISLAGFFAIRAYDKQRLVWQKTFMPGTLGPCLTLSAFGLPTDSPTVLIAGDSRMLNGLIPALFEQELGMRTRNIADAIHFGGNLTTLVLTLKHISPEARANIALLIFDLTAYGLDDAHPVTMSGSEFTHYSLADQIRMAGTSPGAFLKQAWQNFWPNQIRAWRGKRTPPPRSCTLDLPLSAQKARHLGFNPIDHRARPLGTDSLDSHKPRPFGMRYGHALQMLNELHDMGIPMLLFFPPVMQELCGLGYRRQLCEAEWALPQSIAHDFPAMRKRIISMANRAPDPIHAGHFVDLYHLDSLGAVAMSQALIDSLRQRMAAGSLAWDRGQARTRAPQAGDLSAF
jgi:hypothetical protein